MKKFGWPVAIIVLILCLDQWLKYWIKHHMFLGEEIQMAGDWFFLHFVENNGMAFGLEFGGQTGKILLTVFRILLVFFGIYYLLKIIKREEHKGFIICVSLIIAGALGNIIDSVFNAIWYPDLNEYQGGWFEGRVIDMLYFPIVKTDSFTFFSPVFNIADAAISTGVITMIVFQNMFFKKKDLEEVLPEVLEGGESVQDENMEQPNSASDSKENETNQPIIE
ncbi:MAG: signal peptidase II [Bacteroidetes bacterium]|nr:signal peptidase II [Bacteroidota bacterium]